MNSGSTLYRYLLGGSGAATRRGYPTDPALAAQLSPHSSRRSRRQSMTASQRYVTGDRTLIAARPSPVGARSARRHQ